ncbi:MAG: DNA mismatch repair endonuclease MutL [Anaerovoracaceae bacterium]
MIKVLSKNVADKIAAGEVVDRPLSIVKELVENAIDAGASNITVEIKNGGKTYIRVTDNGCGINENEVETAFLRHATSKITTDEDLNNIHTLGFRGEALASISAVSRVELITKTADAKTGTSLKIYGGEVFEKKATGCPDGTTIIVSDLFYNTPARLKFMKTDATESTLIIDFISKIALAYADIRIRLINNGTILFSTNGKGDRYSSIVTVYNKTVGDGLIHISASNDTMSLEGYISRPEFNKTNRRQQIFFVNGRVVTNKIMDIAVMEGYRERLFEGRYPIAYLFFSIKPELIDVNIHPNKKEVRFHQDMPVKEFIAQTIRNGLLSEESIPHVDEKTAMAKQLEKGNTSRKIEAVLKENKQTIQQEQKTHEQVDIKNVLSTLAEERNNKSHSGADISGKNSEMTLKETPAVEYISKPVPKSASSETKLEVRSDEFYHHKQNSSSQPRVAAAPVVQPLPQTEASPKSKNPVPTAEQRDNLFRRIKLTGTIFNTYITAVDADCFYLIDQHAAHERIFYEKLMKQYESEEKLSQTILTPIIADVPYSIKSSEDSWVHIIRNMGFDIEPFGAKSYIIKEIPAFMELSEAQNMVNYFLENINENIDIKNEARINKIIMKSCKSAVKANDVLSMAECQRLIEDLAECENPYSCPHGRPTFIKMTKYEVEKMFKRV